MNQATKVAARCSSCPVAKPLNDAMDVMDCQALARTTNPAEGTEHDNKHDWAPCYSADVTAVTFSREPSDQPSLAKQVGGV